MGKKKAKAKAKAKAPKKPNPAASRKNPRKKRGTHRPGEKATDAQIRKAIEKEKGLVVRAAKSLGMSSRAIYYRLEQSETLRDALADSREVQLDETESHLFKAIKRGEAWAICFYLKTQGRHRGYIERQELGVNANVQHSGAVGIQQLLATVEQSDDALEFFRGIGQDVVAGLLRDSQRNPGSDAGGDGNGATTGPAPPMATGPAFTPDRPGNNGPDQEPNGRPNPGN